MPTVVVRLFNTVGPRQSGQYGMVVPRFVKQALRDEPITVYGDGSQARCFTHVADSVRALIALMDCDAAVGQVFNVGNTSEITILELAERVKEKTRSSSPVAFLSFAEAYEEDFEDMPRRVPCIEKIHAAVGWSPRLDMEAILDSVIDYHAHRPLASTAG